MSQTPAGATPAAQQITAQVTTADDLAPLRQLIAETANSAGLPPDRLGHLIVSVNEVASNALKHGKPPASVTITSSSTTIRVAVRDHGRGFGHDLCTNPNAERPIVALAPTARTPGGRGLWLASNMADSVTISTDGAGTTVTVTMAVGVPAA